MLHVTYAQTTPPDRGRGAGVTVVLVIIGAVVSDRSAAAADFDKQVAPVLLAHCIECHGPADPSGGLNLTTDASLRRGGSSGPVIDKVRPAQSTLLRRLHDKEMPPTKEGKPYPLNDSEVKILAEWVSAGAPWPTDRVLDGFAVSTAKRAGRDWWSLQPIRKPDPPAGPGNLIDRFIRAELTKHGWTPAPPADRRTLIRRVTIDLIGLPPSYEEIEAFARDRDPEAYTKLVDRLLASKHFGERWGRHWLDVVRYAETCGYERDQVKPGIWKYRDYVIDAFNADLPFDRFIREQLAGDEMPDRSERTTIATGFLRLGTWNDEPNDPNEYKYDRLEDMVGTVGSAFLGLTVRCARCHDHKFDPIRQTDYYRLAASFWAGFIESGPRELLGGPDAKQLGYADVHGWTDRGSIVPPLKLLAKGDPRRPREVVDARSPGFVPHLDRPYSNPPSGSTVTLRRTQLAAWITDPTHPLTARVWVNRLWQYHFGRGLVRSSDNFGFTGDRPTHPELLDRLASELIAGGWKSKPLHRLMVLSETYQQASIHPDESAYAKVDAANDRRWRAERRRMDAEVIHDALLSAGGNLKLERFGGPSFAPVIAAEALEGLSMKSGAWKPSPPEEQGRRAVYLFSKRGLLPPQLTTFDFPDTTLPCGKRDVTIVPTQALALLNNPLVHQQSKALAERVVKASPDREQRIRTAWRIALGRDPRPAESEAAVAHLERMAARLGDRLGPDGPIVSLCHVLLNTNEFLYVD